MKFQAIKDNAKRLYADALNHWDHPRNLYGHNSPLQTAPAFDAVLPFVLATQAERSELRTFAESFQASKDDWLAISAQSDGKLSAFNRVVLKAREAGLELIDKWDVRQAGKLIELFPESVPAKYRNQPLVCSMADTDDCDWIVEVEEAPRRTMKL